MGSIQLNGDGAYQGYAGYNINGRVAFIQKTDPVSNGGNGWHYHGLYNTENQQWSLLHFDGSNVGAAFTSTFIYGGGNHAPVYVYPNYVRLNHIDGSTVNTRLETTGYGVSVTDGLNVSGVSTFQDDVNIGTGSTVAFFDISAGRVGIGSTTPTKVLDVNGTLGVSGASVFTSNVRITPSLSNQTALSFDTQLNPGGFITPGISFNMSNTSRYAIYNYYNNTDGYVYHKLASNSNFEIGLDEGSFIVGDNWCFSSNDKSI